MFRNIERTTLGRLRTVGLVSLLLFRTVLAHTQVTVPNTFVEGQVASASDVNENFTAIADVLPIALGSVAADGTLLVGYGATVSRRTLGYYRIALATPYDPATHVVMVTTTVVHHDDEAATAFVHVDPFTHDLVIRMVPFFREGGFFFVVFAP
jgi:hypothetical protein